MIRVKLKNGSIRLVPEITANMLAKSHGAVILDRNDIKTELPEELQKTPIVTNLPDFAKQIEALREENQKLTKVNKKLSEDIIQLMNQIEKLKENEQAIQTDVKKTKERKASIDPNS